MKKVFTLTISGIPWAFSTSASAPASIGGITYTIKPWLDFRSIRITGDRWDVRDGRGTPGTLRCRLFDVGQALTSLFSSELLSATESQLMVDMAVSGGVGEIVSVYDHASFGATGTLYIGLETVTYTGKTNAGGGVTYDRFDGVARALYGSPGYSHKVYSVDDPGYQSNPIVSDHPYCWDGRFLSLYEYVVDEHSGACTLVSCLWRGYMRGGATIETDGSVSIGGVSLLDIVNRRIGTSPGSATAQTVEESLDGAGDPTWTGLPQDDPGLGEIFYYIDDDADAEEDLRLSWSDGTVDSITFTSGVRRSIDVLTDALVGATYGCDIYAAVRNNETRVEFANNSGAHTVVLQWLNLELARALGFDSQAYGPIDHVGSSYRTITAERSPSRTYHSSRATRIYLADSTIDLPTGGGTGVAIISDAVEVHVSNSDGETREIVRCDSIDTSDTTNGPYIDVRCRGPIGDPGLPLCYPLWTDESTPIQIRQVVCSSLISGGEFSVYLLSSFDGSAYNGSWDVLPEGWGGELPALYLDEDSFKCVNGAFSEPQTWILDEETTIGDVLGPICQLEGVALGCRNGLLCAYRVAEHDEENAVAITDASSIVVAPTIAQYAGLLINSVKPSLNWSINKREFLSTEHTLTDIRARSWVNGYQTMTVEHKGIRRTEDAELAEDLEATRDDLFLRFGLPSYVVVLELQESELGTDAGPGTTLSLTLSQVRNPYTGSIGLSGILAQIIEYEHDVVKGVIKVTALLQRQARRLGPYSPALLVTAYNAGTGELSVDTDAMSWPNSTDLDRFAAGDLVTVYRVDDDTVTGNTTIASVAAASVFVDAALLLSDGNPPAAGDRVRFRDYGAVGTHEKKSCFIADESTKDVGAAGEPYYWQ